MVIRGVLLGILFGVLFGFCMASNVKSEHLIYLPGVPNTPAIQNILADGERTWCVNANIANYPGFVAQLQTTYDSQRVEFGNANRQIAGTYENVTAAKNAGCEVWHNGRYDSFCSGCAANVYYGNWPVTVNYKLSLGFVDWKSAQGHEEGHIHGLHEQYRDSGGTIACTRRTDTVMDCGSFVWQLQPLDVGRICDLYGVPGERFSACAPPEPEFFHRADGWSYHFATQVWWNPLGEPELHPCNADGLRWDAVLGVYLRQGTVLYNPRGYWLEVGGC